MEPLYANICFGIKTFFCTHTYSNFFTVQHPIAKYQNYFMILTLFHKVEIIYIYSLINFKLNKSACQQKYSYIILRIKQRGSGTNYPILKTSQKNIQ